MALLHQTTITDFAVEYLGVQMAPDEHFERVTINAFPEHNNKLCGVGSTPQEAYADARQQAAALHQAGLLPVHFDGLPADTLPEWAEANGVHLDGPLESYPACTVALYLKTR